MTFGRVVETNFEHTGYSNLFLHRNSIYLESPKEVIAVARFRTSCAIETGRYIIPPTPPEHRLCTYCTSGKVDNELHFIIEWCHLEITIEKVFIIQQYNTMQSLMAYPT